MAVEGEPLTSRIERAVPEWEIFDEKPILHPASFIPAAHDHSEVNHQKSRNVKEKLFFEEGATTQTSSGGQHRMSSISSMPQGQDELLRKRKAARHCHRRTQSKTFDPSFVSALLSAPPHNF